MKLSTIRRLTKEMLRGAEVPPWIDELFGALNPFLDQVVTALSNNLTFTDNFAGSALTSKMTHGIAMQLNARAKGKVIGVLLMSAGGEIVSGFGWTLLANGKLSITVKFDAGGSTEATCVFQVLEAR